MSCNTRYWQSMKCSAPERPQNAALAAENNSSLAALKAARDAQDERWSYVPQDQSKSQSNSTARATSQPPK